jgi:ribosome maturation factor RimP
VIEGTLKRVDDTGITVEAKGGRAVDIGWPEILAARLAVSL